MDNLFLLATSEPVKKSSCDSSKAAPNPSSDWLGEQIGDCNKLGRKKGRLGRSHFSFCSAVHNSNFWAWLSSTTLRFSILFYTLRNLKLKLIRYQLITKKKFRKDPCTHTCVRAVIARTSLLVLCARVYGSYVRVRARIFMKFFFVIN